MATLLLSNQDTNFCKVLKQFLRVGVRATLNVTINLIEIAVYVKTYFLMWSRLGGNSLDLLFDSNLLIKRLSTFHLCVLEMRGAMILTIT